MSLTDTLECMTVEPPCPTTAHKRPTTSHKRLLNLGWSVTGVSTVIAYNRC